MSSLEGRILDDDDSITKLLRSSRRIAVLGIKTEAQADAAAFYVPKYAFEVGFDIVPVPVYFPEAKEILGQPVYRRLADIPEPRIDIVNVFRRPQDLAAHLEDIISARPKAVWLQLGIRDDAFAAKLTAAGIAVVQDRCLLVELRSRGSFFGRQDSSQ